MSDIIQIGDPPIDVHLRRSARARRYSLRISNANGIVSLTLPHRASQKAAIGFAREQEAWLRRNLEKRPAQVIPRFGETFMCDGHEVVLKQGLRRAPQLQDGVLTIYGHPDELGARLRGFLKTRARERLVPAAQKYAALLGRPIRRVSLRDTRSRWGSCTSDGNLMFSWRLAMAPVAVQDYVAAHEVCHLIEMNHSAAYWQLVASIFPDFQQQRNWLKTHGGLLHRYML